MLTTCSLPVDIGYRENIDFSWAHHSTFSSIKSMQNYPRGTSSTSVMLV